jgi:hypothetical protein
VDCAGVTEAAVLVSLFLIISVCAGLSRLSLSLAGDSCLFLMWKGLTHFFRESVRDCVCGWIPPLSKQILTAVELRVPQGLSSFKLPNLSIIWNCKFRICSYNKLSYMVINIFHPYKETNGKYVSHSLRSVRNIRDELFNTLCPLLVYMFIYYR